MELVEADPLVRHALLEAAERQGRIAGYQFNDRLGNLVVCSGNIQNFRPSCLRCTVERYGFDGVVRPAGLLNRLPIATVCSRSSRTWHDRVWPSGPLDRVAIDLFLDTDRELPDIVVVGQVNWAYALRSSSALRKADQRLPQCRHHLLGDESPLFGLVERHDAPANFRFLGHGRFRSHNEEAARLLLEGLGVAVNELRHDRSVVPMPEKLGG